LQGNGFPAEMAEPVSVDRKPIERKESFGGILASILPYLVVIWAFYGGFSFASDMVAGEKERFTLETLLVSPIERTHAALGKFAALAMLCFISGVSSLFAVAIGSAVPIDVIQGLFPDGIRLSVGTIAWIIGIVLPLSMFFAALLLAVSTYSRNTRECQGYLTLVSFIVLMPAVFSQFVGYTDFARAGWINAVPILNSANVLRLAMSGSFDWVGAMVTLAVNLFLALAGIWLVVRLFNQERVLWRI
jgi:sodium transport system permease protein